jgi:hypothetical protein
LTLYARFPKEATVEATFKGRQASYRFVKPVMVVVVVVAIMISLFRF